MRNFDKRLLLGTNIAIWHHPETFNDPRVKAYFEQASIGLVRMPGGSTSDQYFWNGNGVRSGNTVDRTKYKAHRWAIDYSDWKPGFSGFWGFPKDTKTAKLETWHGHANVKDQHEFIRRVGAQALVTVNAGTGTPKDAAEWVRWARQMDYDVRYWEVGNELGGDWESGTVRPDGKRMDGKMYGEIYAQFAAAMKAVDADAKVGSQGGVDFIEGALSHHEVPVDFVTFHDYYNAEGNTIAARFKTLERIRKQISDIRQAIEKHRPGADIPIGITEYNCKLFEDEGTSDVFSGLWTVAAVGEMLYGGLDFATQWDAFTQKRDNGGGHGFMIEMGVVPKAEYWALHLLSQFLGSELLAVEDSSDDLRTYASRDPSGALFLVAVNTSQDAAYTASVDLGGANVAPVATGMRFSYHEYAWDPDLFAPLYNNGPTRFRVGNAGTPRIELPPFSATAMRFEPASSSPALVVEGPEDIFVAAGHRAELVVEAFDTKGQPASGVELRVALEGLPGVEGTTVAPRTDDTGRARIGVSASGQAHQGYLLVSAPGYVSQKHSLQVLSSALLIHGPKKLPTRQEASFLVASRYRDQAGQYRLQNAFSVDGTFGIAGREEQPLRFEGGLARFVLGVPKAGEYTVKVTAGELSAEAQVAFFDTERKNTTVLTFDGQQLPHSLEGKGPYQTNHGISANQGVLELVVDGITGWTQDRLAIGELDKVSGLDRENIVALAVDILRPRDLDLGQWASLIFVLQSHDNYWMPLPEVKLQELTPGEWKHVELELSDQQRSSMKAFFKVITAVNSGTKLKGSLYFDNLGFVVRTERK